MEQLTITADLEDYAVGLSGKLNLHEFSGIGEAWFNADDVKTFCKNLKQLSSEMDGAVELIGSQSKPNGSEYLETLSLRCNVLSSSKLNGIVGVHVMLADHPYSDCRKEEIRKVSGELQVRNHKMEEFSNNLLKLLNGNEHQVVLHGGAGI